MLKKILTWYYGEASIRKKLVISYLLLVAVPILVLGSYAYSNAKWHLINQTKATMENNVNTLVADMEGKLKRENDNIKYLSYNTKFRQVLQNAKIDRISLAQELNESVEPNFWYFITSDENLHSVEIFSKEVDTEVGSFIKPYAGCEGEDWVSYHEKHYNTQWVFSSGEFFASRTLLDAKTSSVPIGIIKINVYLADMISSISYNNYLNNGVLLLDKEGEIMYQRDLKNDKLSTTILQEIKKQKLGGSIDRAEYLMVSKSIGDSGIQLYYYIDKEEILGEIYKILRSTLYIVGILLAGIIILISILSRVLSGRILELKESAEKVASGDFLFPVQREYTDEIGIVAKSFRNMGIRLDGMIRENYELGKKQRAAELKALQAMINPHFLYNCLSSIKWKAIRAEQEEISEITGLLAKFYRTTLNGGKQLTTVENELENIKAYLELQERTHDEAFLVEYQIQGEGLELTMPNFLLQPLVENAICHGIDYIEENKEGLIIIRYEKQGELLLFSVFNNGPILEEERLKNILHTPGKGYGIYNIQERIRMYYDEECGVSASVSTEGHTCFTVKIKEEMKQQV